MPLADQTRLRNRLLRHLTAQDFARLTPHMEPMELRKDDELVTIGQPFEHADFPECGIGSIITISPEGQMIESGLFGRDGFSPLSLVTGVGRSPYRCVIQVSGECHRVAEGALREATQTSPALREILLRYVHALSVQTSYTALSNAVHPIGERQARWLLMCHDRAVGDELGLTYDFLSIMLAVRRPSVTTALHVLEGNLHPRRAGQHHRD